MNIPHHHHKFQRGFTLLEVLIALLVLSIGLVGLASLHLNSLKASHSSYYRSIASAIAHDLEERAWLALAQPGSGCPDFYDTSKSSARKDFLDHWDAANADLLGLPELEVDVAPVSGAVPPQWNLTVKWAEGRYDDVDQNGKESFTYTMSVICPNS